MAAHAWKERRNWMRGAMSVRSCKRSKGQGGFSQYALSFDTARSRWSAFTCSVWHACAQNKTAQAAARRQACAGCCVSRGGLQPSTAPERLPLSGPPCRAAGKQARAPVRTRGKACTDRGAGTAAWGTMAALRSPPSARMCSHVFGLRRASTRERRRRHAANAWGASLSSLRLSHPSRPQATPLVCLQAR